MCEEWYSECRLDMFTPGVVDKSLEVCDASSLLCYRLKDVWNTPEEFCNSMGFAVRDMECFDGVPAASRKGKVISKEKRDMSIVIYLICAAGITVAVVITSMVCSNRKERVKDIRKLRLKALELRQMIDKRENIVGKELE